jgi:Tfp pilus assembly protein PilO
MSNLIHEIEEKKALSQALSQKIAALSTVQSEYQQAEPKLFVLDEALPTKPDIKYVVQAIEKLANDNDISLLSLSSSEYPLDKDVTFSPELKRTNKVFSFTVSGEFANIRQFIEQIQQLRRVLVIDSITFSLTELSGSKVLQANIVVNMQYFDKSEAVKAK